MKEFNKLMTLTYQAWLMSGKPKEKEGLIKHVFISNAGFLDRLNSLLA
jgi:hypothetical protein